MFGGSPMWLVSHPTLAAAVDGPRVEPYEAQPFRVFEARKFLNGIKGDGLEVLYSVALTMGLRQGEALGLRWQDVDLELGTLRITKQLQGSMAISPHRPVSSATA